MAVVTLVLGASFLHYLGYDLFGGNFWEIFVLSVYAAVHDLLKSL
jgi:hypothetical protein